MYFTSREMKKRGWDLELLISSPDHSARSRHGYGPMHDGDIIHILHADLVCDGEPAIKNWEKPDSLRLILMSFDLTKLIFWEPYGRWLVNPMPVDYDLTDFIHVHAFRKIIMNDEDLNLSKLSSPDITKPLSGMPYKDWEILWELLNKIRVKRIENRIKHPRKSRTMKFDDDILDICLKRTLNRVDAILNEQLYWGAPNYNGKYLSFRPTPNFEAK